jgi:hypothetical protein
MAGVASFADTAFTIIPWDTEDWDTMALFTTGGAAKFTAATAGYYLVTCMIGILGPVWASPETCALNLYKNGVIWSVLDAYCADHAGTPYAQYLSGSEIIYLTAGEYISTYISQNSGVAVNGTTGSTAHMTISRVPAT